MATSTADVIATQEQLLGAIDQLYVNFKKDGADRKTSDYLRRRLETLDQYWVEFHNNHVNLLSYGDQSHSYFTTQQYEHAKVKYGQIREAIKSYAHTPLLKPPTFGPGLAGASGSPRSETPPPIKESKATSSKTEELLRKQASNFKAFQRTATSIKLDDVTEKWEFEDLLRNLQIRWSAIDSLHWELDMELSGSNQQYERQFSDYEAHYNELKKAINKKMWSVAHVEKATPKIEIPTFNGSYIQWVSFKDLFTETVRNNTSLSNAQKMQFLKGKVKGEAERLIQHLHISSENFTACWDILTHRYDNKKLIFTTHINSLINVPTVQHLSVNSIKKLHDTTNECLNAIKNLGVDIQTWDPLLVHILAQKLDVELYSDYMESLKHPRELPALADFMTFLETKFTTLETSRKKQESPAQKPVAYNNPPKYNVPLKSAHYNNAVTSNAKPLPQPANKKDAKPFRCPICSTNNHAMFFCKVFMNMQPNLKKTTVLKHNMCLNCLHNHQGKSCSSENKCRECNLDHNSLLHNAFSSTATTDSNQSGSSAVAVRTDQQVQSSHASQNMHSETLLATALIKVKAVDGSYHTMRALLDQGSQTSLITENAAQILQVCRQKCMGVISGIGAKESSCKGMVNIECSSTAGDFTFETNAYIMSKLIRNLPSTSFSKPDWVYLDHINLADPEFYVSRPVDILLGADVYSTLLMEGLYRTSTKLPVAQQTKLGWILSGNVTTFHCNVILYDIRHIQNFWEIEEITEPSDLSQEDQQCIELYKSSTTRREDGRYEVKMPLKTGFDLNIGESKKKAIAQFNQLERKFQKQPDIASEYKLFVDEYVSLGHMQPSNESTSQQTSCYLPHHCVLRNESSTTKLRVVFNASSKTSSNFSLNDVMCRGPNLQQDLQSLIIKWRQYQFAFTADIEKMFRQIWVHPEHRELQKIVWRDDPSQRLQDYQLSTVTYGTKAAPFLAMMTLKQLACDERQNYQESSAPDVLQQSFYMDDLLHGAHSEEQAQQLKSDMIKLLSSGGFNLRKWRSNLPELLDHSSEKQDFEFKQTESSKTLGLGWNPQQDVFVFHPIDLSTKEPTKRTLLSDISKLFDPLGWLTPVTTKLKILFQDVWKSETQWDEPVPSSISYEWAQIKEDLRKVGQFQIPRWLKIEERSALELHGFCDSSQKAYSCVVYCKTKVNDTTSITIVAGKSKLVPVDKHVTLPRLELSGALLLSKLMTKIKECLSAYDIKMYGWTDSMVVLGWLNGDPNRWNTFVANRVTQITKQMPAECWNYVKSKENPADCASRGISAAQLLDQSLWWQGPDWLQNYEPKQEKVVHTTDQEMKKRTQVHITQLCNEKEVVNELVSKYSSLTKASRVLAWMLRFTRKGNKPPFLTLTEIKEASEIIIKQIQEDQFSEELECLRAGKSVSNKSQICSLNPILDGKGVLRVGGRLKHANLDPDMRNPILIRSNTRLADLIIDQAHELSFHGGARLTTSFMRRKYWLLGGNQATKKRLRHCVKCRKNDPRDQHQIMGDLPAARTNPSRPFYHTGVDYTGYVTVKASKGRGIKTTKGYVAVFVCMATKAVHLEIVSDMTSSAFLAALRRMAARRGLPRHMYSDQGTNFIGANNVLQQEYFNLQEILDEHSMKEVCEMGVQWHFNAPSWPSAGGLWESSVRSLKHHLKRVVGEQNLTFEEYGTLLAQLEACLNSRPLCPLTEDPEDLDFLTPSHFLSSGPTLTLYETEKDLRTRWQLTQKIFRDIWNRWRSEYLTQLSSRCKWRQPQPNIRMNDVVIIKDDNLPPGKWSLGRVVELHPGSDGYVRVVTLKTKNGLLKRPLVKLSVLPINDQERPSNSMANQAPENVEVKPPRSERRKAPGRSKFTSLVLALTVFLSTFSNVNCSMLNVTKFREDQGLYFDKLHNMQVIKEDWTVVVYYDIQPYSQSINALNEYLQYLTKVCDTCDNKQKYCAIVLNQLRHGYAELSYNNAMLLRQHFSTLSPTPSIKQTQTRWRRGLIDGVGYIANSLFGVLDDRFAEQYQKDISTVRGNEQHLIALWKNQTSIIESEYNFIQRTEDTLNQQRKFIHQQTIFLENSLNAARSQLQEINNMNEFILGALTASNMLQSLKDIQEMLIDTLTDIYQGSFSFHIVPPNQLRKELNLINSQVSKDVSLPIDNTLTDLRSIYHLLKVKARITNNFVLFEIKVPLVLRDSYEMYKIMPIPQKVQNNNMITIVPISDYLAINLNKDTYISLTETDIRRCLQNEDTFFCRLSRPMYHIKTKENFCIKNQVTGDCMYNTETCTTKLYETNKPNNHLFFTCNGSQARVICGDQVTAAQLTGAGLITINENCIVRTESFTLHAHRQESSRINNKHDVPIPVLAPINSMINISISTVRMANDTQESDRKQLEYIGDSIKKAKENAELTSNVSYHDVHHYVVIYALVCAGGIAAAVVAYRRRGGRKSPSREKCQCMQMKTISGRTNQSLDEASEINSATIDINDRAQEPEVLRVHSNNRGSSPFHQKLDFPTIEAMV